MISFKRDVYKVRPMPKPERPVIQTTWYVSQPQGGVVDYCLPITTQVFKVPNAAPVALGEFLYMDFQNNIPLQPVGSNRIYNISQTSTQNPETLGQIKAVTVDNLGEIVKMQEGFCNPLRMLQEITITDAYQFRTQACQAEIKNPLKIDAFNINAGVISNSSQLYTPESINSNFTNFVAEFSLAGFSGTTNFVKSGNRTYEISSDGILTNAEVC